MMFQHENIKFANQELLWFNGDSEDRYLTHLKERYADLKENQWINRSFTYKFNNHGFRCDQFNDTPNIVTLGCSLTFCMGVPIEDSWPTLVANELNLTCFNLGVQAASHDTAFRLAYHWLEKIKPKIVVLWGPDQDRFELSADQQFYSYLPNKPDLYPGRDFYKQWITNSTNGLLNKTKNTLAIKYLCNKLDIKFIDMLDLKRAYNFRADLARDLSHPGIKSNLTIAKAVLSSIHVW